ncbi:MAG: 3-oxoacyl-ACP synthase III family protein [Bacteroidia bacterium]
MSYKIIGSGYYIPTKKITNIEFAQHHFYTESGEPFPQSNEVIAEKFQEITGIAERRYVENHLTTSDIAYLAAKEAIFNSGVDPETIDYIIMAHNFGDVKKGTIQSDILPSLACRVKHLLKIKNPNCVAYDVLFGCPGWIEGMIQAKAFIQAGMAKTCLVIGAETLSRVVDHHDRDSMIFSDGAGATILSMSDEDGGILAHQTATHTYDEANYLHFGKSNKKDLDPNIRYIKMAGRKIYEFALSNVPKAMKTCWDKTGLPVEKITKVLLHQANEKMDEAIIHRFYKLYKQTPPKDIMPMNIKTLGNSSVATVPTLYHMIIKGELENHSLKKGDYILFASVGAGMHINAIAYQM